MTDKELNSIGKWLNTKGYDLDLTDCFWMEDWIANETKFRDIAELLQEYHKEQLLIHSVVVPKGTFCCMCEKEKANTGYDMRFCKSCWDENGKA